MMKNRFPIRNGLNRLAGSFIFLLAVIALPAISPGSTVADCFKTVSGYNLGCHCAQAGYSNRVGTNHYPFLLTGFLLSLLSKDYSGGG
jgi:hypothetical protein